MSPVRIAGIIVLVALIAFDVFTFVTRGFSVPILLIAVIAVICLVMMVTGKSSR